MPDASTPPLPLRRIPVSSTPLRTHLVLLLSLLTCALLSPALAEAETAADAAQPATAPPYSRVAVERVSTSIYIGRVSLTMPPFERRGDTYHSTYRASVVPYFFRNERGELSITLPPADLARLAAGERVPFTGQAANTAGEPRRIEGHADPADAYSGQIKVRVFVTEKIQLIFNTTYRFTGA